MWLYKHATKTLTIYIHLFGFRQSSSHLLFLTHKVMFTTISLLWHPWYFSSHTAQAMRNFLSNLHVSQSHSLLSIIFSICFNFQPILSRVVSYLTKSHHINEHYTTCFISSRIVSPVSLTPGGGRALTPHFARYAPRQSEKWGGGGGLRMKMRGSGASSSVKMGGSRASSSVKWGLRSELERENGGRR